MKLLAPLTLIATLWLAGCDTTDVEQPDANQNGTGSTKSIAPTVTFNGGNTIPLSELLTANWMKDYSSKFRVDDGETGGNIDNWKWQILATLDDVVYFSFRVNPGGSSVKLFNITAKGDWETHLEDFKWSLLRATGTGWDGEWEDTHSESASRLKIVDDRIPVSLRLANDSNDIETGDTIRMEIKNESTKDTTLVASDYSGMRMVGNYEAKLGPGESATLRWLVLVARGNSAWLEISWSNAGQSKRYTFPIR